MKKLLSLFMISALLMAQSAPSWATIGVSDQGTYEGEAMAINVSTGMTGAMSGGVYTITGGAVGTDGNWTSDGLAVSLDLAPTKFIATGSSGDFFATGFTVGTGDVTFGQGGKVDGDTNGTMKLIEASDTLSFIFSGTTIQLDSSDGGFQFGMTDATEGRVDFLTNGDTDDYMSVTTASNVPTIVTLGTSNLAIIPDGGTTAVTGILTVSSGLTASSTITLQNSETIINSVNGTVTVGGATNPILNVLDDGTSNSDAYLSLSADAAADNGDVWRLNSDGATNSLFFENNTSGSQATIFTVAANGDVTTTSDLLIDGTTPQLQIGSTTGQGSPIVFEGATADASELTLAVPDIAGDITYTISGSTTVSSFIPAFQNDATDDVSLIFEGATADAFETTITMADPTADQTITVPQGGSTAAFMLTSLTTNAPDAANSVTGTSNGLLFEGATADGFETTLSPVDPTADQTVSIANAGVANALMFTSLTTNTIDAANSAWFASNSMVLEGATADAFETTITPVDATADATWSIPNFAVAASFLGSTLTTNNVDAANSVWGISNSLVFEGSSADAFETTLAPTNVGADATITLPTISGTLHGSGAAVALTPGATPTLTVVAGKQVFTYAPADNIDATFNASGTGSSGDEMTFIFTTDAAGAGDEVMTFGTNMHSTGTLTMANLVSDIYVVSFVSNGTKWVETARTAVQTT